MFHYFQAPEARSFYEEQARFVDHIDDMADRPHDGKALWSPVRMMTLLNRERGPRIADRVLGQDDLQPMMDAVLALRMERGNKALMLEAAKVLSADQALTAYAMASELMRSDGAYSAEERRHLDLLALMLSISQVEAERIDSVFELLHAPLESARSATAGIPSAVS